MAINYLIIIVRHILQTSHSTHNPINHRALSLPLRLHEPQRFGIDRYHPFDILFHAFRKFGVYLDPDAHPGTWVSGQVGNHLIGNRDHLHFGGGGVQHCGTELLQDSEFALTCD